MSDLDSDRYYMGFMANMDQDRATARFRQRYGVDPHQVVIERGLLWVGPIPEGCARRQIVDSGPK